MPCQCKTEKEKILRGIEMCSQMEGHWYNNTRPSSGYKSEVVEIRKILHSLLEVKCKCLKGKK